MISALGLSLVLAAQTPPPSSLYPLIRLAGYLPAIEDRGRSGEEAQAFVQGNGEDSFPWTSPQMEIRAREDMSRTSLSVVFNWVWLTDGGERRPVWFARLRAMDWHGTVERFADSRTCPGVEESVRQLDALPPIKPWAPRLPDPTTTAIDVGGYLHDNTYTIRMRGTFSDRPEGHRLELIGGSDTPFAPVVADTLTRLKPCWTETAPPRA